MRLYLVRHAAVVPQPEQPSERWHLSAEGRAGADALAAEADWSTVVRLYSSAEPKAITTAQRIAMRHGLPVSVEPALGEVERPWADGDYKALAHRFLQGEAVEGWEPHEAARARIRTAIDAVLEAHPESDVAVVSHGLALSLLLAEVLRLDGAATVQLWDSIRFPDLAILDTEAATLRRRFGS